MAKVLQWVETDSQYIAVLQPREIFDEDSFFEDRHEYEAIILGQRKDTEKRIGMPMLTTRSGSLWHKPRYGWLLPKRLSPLNSSRQ